MKTTKQILEWIENELPRLEERKEEVAKILEDKKTRRVQKTIAMREWYACELAVTMFGRLKRFIHRQGGELGWVIDENGNLGVEEISDENDES